MQACCSCIAEKEMEREKKRLSPQQQAKLAFDTVARLNTATFTDSTKRI